MFSAVLLVLVAVIVVLNVVLLSRLRGQYALESRLRDDLGRARQQQSEESRAQREELAGALQRFGGNTVHELDKIRTVVDQRLHALQIDNSAKLEQMRQTVDEKLQSTLETRLGES